MKFYLILLSLLVIFSSITYGERIMKFGNNTTDTDTQTWFSYTSNAYGFGAINFTANDTFYLGDVEIYVSQIQAPLSPIYASIYNVDVNGNKGSQVGGDSAVTTLTSTGYTNISFFVNSPNLVSGNKYWLVFRNTTYTTGYFRIGSSTGSKSIWYAFNQSFTNEPMFFWNEQYVNIGLWRLSGSIISSSAGYTTPILAGEPQTIYFNITNNTLTPDLPSITQANATLNYNGTNYNMLFNSVDNVTAQFYYTFNTPVFTSSQIVNFNFSYYANNVLGTTGYYQQTVYPLQSLNITNSPCIAPMQTAYNFTFYDEDNLTTLSMDSVDYDFSYGLSNNTQSRTFGHLSNVNNVFICFNNTIANTFYIGSGQLFYQKSGWVARRFYTFDNQTLDNQTRNISLYDLNNANAQAFQLAITDTSGNGLANRYVYLLRWYPNLNAYNVVDIGLTDGTGNTVTYVRPQDVDYRIGVYYTNGSLIYLAPPVRMVCLTSPCSYSLRIAPGVVDYYSLLLIQYSLTFNKTTNIWTFIYSDASQRTNLMNLTVYKDTGDSSNIICNSIASGYVGVITCNTTGYTGNLRAIAERITTYSVTLAQLTVNVFTEVFISNWILWLSVLLAIPIVMVFAMYSPYAALIGGVLSLIPALIFNIVGIGIVAAFAILAGIIAHFIGRKS